LYLNQYKPQNDWKAVALFADRAIAPQKLTIFQQELIANNRLLPIYLNELQNPDSVAIAIIQLITCPDKDAPQIIENLKQQKLDADIIKLVETVLLAKFKDLSREEIEAMFLLSDLKDTRVYKDALQEGLKKGLRRGLRKGLQKGLRKGKKDVDTIAVNLLKAGMDIQQVSAVTGLTIEQVSLLGK
jgi:predicted transposase/invertase (TIGR01784 family)